MTRIRLVRLVPIVAAFGALLALSGSVTASGAVTTHFHQQVDASTDGSGTGCGLTGVATSTFNGVLVTLAHADGQSDAHGTFTGDIVFVPFDPALPTYTGHFTQRFSQRVGEREAAAFEFASNLTGDDGTTLRIHETLHYSTSAGGNAVSFDMQRCSR